MQRAAGLVIAAGAIALANDAIFAPVVENKPPFQNLNWRIIPATGILAGVLVGLDLMLPKFGTRLAALVLLSVLVIPYGKAPTPLETVATALGYSKKVL